MASDCQSASFLDYEADGRLFDGVYTYSPSRGTMSGTFALQAYSVTDAGLEVQPGMHVFQVTCDPQKLVEDMQIETRATSSVADAIETGVAGDAGTFTSVAVQ